MGSKGLALFVLVVFLMIPFEIWGQSQNVNQKIDSLYGVIYGGPFYNDFEISTNHLNKIQLLAEQNNLVSRIAQCHINRAWLAQNFNDLKLMQFGINQAKLLERAYPDSLSAVLKGDIAYTEASYLRRLGDYLGAISAYRNIVNGELTDSLLFYDTFTSIGINYLSSGNVARALENYQKALFYLPKSLDEENYQLEQSIGYQSIGTAYITMYKQTSDSMFASKAKEYLEQSLLLLESLTDLPAQRINKSSTLINLSKAYALQGDHQKALTLLTPARELLRSNEAFLNYVEKQKGDILLEKGKPIQASLSYRKALKIANAKYGSSDARTMELIQRLSKSSREEGKIKESIMYAKNGLSSFKGKSEFLSIESKAILILPLQVEYVLSRFKKALLDDQVNFSDSVLVDFHQVVQLAETLRKTFPSREFKEFLSVQSKELMEGAIMLAWKNYQKTKNGRYISEAFWFSEKSKSLTLLEKIQGREAIKYANIPDSALVKTDKLRREITLAEEILKKSNHKDEKTLNLLENKHTDLEKHIAFLEKEFPTYYQLKYDDNVPDLDNIQKGLKHGELIIHYFAAKEFLYAIYLSKELRSFKKYELSKEKFNNYLSCLHTNPAKNKDSFPFETYRKLSMEISRQIFDFELLKGVDQLNIIPDGLLHYLPFETLINDLSGKFMVEDFDISYELSLKLRKINNQLQNNKINNYSGFAPTYRTGQVVTLRNGQGNRRIKEYKLGRLLYNTLEVYEMQKILGGVAYYGEEATEAAFLKQVKPHSIFHLSAHGVSNEQSPLNSAIFFTNPNEQFGKNDNVLHAHEIYGISIPESVGILSACESGYGKYASGEGLISLQRAFYYAGCNSLIASLWNANDESSYRIMLNFGKYLIKGERKSHALRLAKIDFINAYSPAFRHPYYWANYTLTGNYGKMNFENKNRDWLLYGLILSGFLLGVFMIIKKQKSLNRTR